MMGTSERDVVLKSWELREDNSIIKEVATKGKFIQMCIEYLARKRRITLEESRRFFNQIANDYVYRLMGDKLVCKAEDVLRNLNRDYKSVYYQFAFDSDDNDVKMSLLDHLKKKNLSEFNNEIKEYEFYWKLLNEIRNNDELVKIVIEEIGKINLEKLYRKDESYRKMLVVKTFLQTENDELLEKFDKNICWKYLISNKNYSQLIIWSHINYNKSKQISEEEYQNALQQKFSSWDIDKEMFEQAIEKLETPTEMLRNSFAANGIIFPDEIENVQKILYRIFTTESLELNRSLVESLPLAKYLIENNNLSVLLEDFVSVDDIQNNKTIFSDKMK